MVVCGKKLLVLNVNGLLFATSVKGKRRPKRRCDAEVGKYFVYKRPFCDSFIRFCLENFVVGVWSSALEWLIRIPFNPFDNTPRVRVARWYNARPLVDYVFGEAKENLAFVWHQEQCTDTGIKHPGSEHKPLFLKELWKLWTKVDQNLPWAESDFVPRNTVLIDDSAYKAMNNPPHTGIFPKTYMATNFGDRYVEPYGELRTYLENLLESPNVQTYLEGHGIGEPSIVVGDPQFGDILSAIRLKTDKENGVPRHLTGMSFLLGHDPTHPVDHGRQDSVTLVHTTRAEVVDTDDPHVVVGLVPQDSDHERKDTVVSPHPGMPQVRDLDGSEDVKLVPHKQGRPSSDIVSRELAGSSNDVAPHPLPKLKTYGDAADIASLVKSLRIDLKALGIDEHRSEPNRKGKTQILNRRAAFHWNFGGAERGRSILSNMRF